jgi:hypothetical protein
MEGWTLTALGLTFGLSSGSFMASLPAAFLW